MKISKQSINAATVIVAVVLVILFGLTIFNYYQSGKISYSTISTASMLLLILVIGRKSALKDTKD